MCAILSADLTVSTIGLNANSLDLARLHVYQVFIVFQLHLKMKPSLSAIKVYMYNVRAYNYVHVLYNLKVVLPEFMSTVWSQTLYLQFYCFLSCLYLQFYCFLSLVDIL